MKTLPVKCSFAVILPAHNEEEAIAPTVHEVMAALSAWLLDFETLTCTPDDLLRHIGRPFAPDNRPTQPQALAA